MRTKAVILAAATTLLTAIGSMALATDSGTVTGTWLLEDGSMAIEIAACDDGLCGTLVWLQHEGEVGTVVLSKLPAEANGKGSYKYGEFVDVNTGRTYYRCELRVQDDGRLRLQGQAGVVKDGRVVTSRFPTTLHFTRTDKAALAAS